MAVNRDFIGWTFPPTAPYEVSRVKIEEYAEAIGDTNPIYRDPEAAKAAGYPDVIAPPTFAIVISMRASREAVATPDLGVDYSRVVHGEQKFTHGRALCAGDVVTGESTITSIRGTGALTMITTETVITTVEGERVCTATSTIVERGDGS